MRIDLDGYFDRIGFAQAHTASADTLRTLHWLHPQAIPFENLDPFLGRPVRLEPDAVRKKLVQGGRGGYCFEHNLLFMHALRALGFRVRGLAARVLWNEPEDAVTPRSHMLLCVEAEGSAYVADVGFGGLTPTAPLRFETGVAQETPHERFRMMEAGNGFRLEAEIEGTWRVLYRFDLSEQFDVDYVAANFFLSTHPTSHFVTELVAARALPDRRLMLSNNSLTTYHTGGAVEKATLHTVDAMADALHQSFGIDVPDPALFAVAVQEKGILARGDV